MCEDKVTCESVQRVLGEHSMPELTLAQDEHLAACEDCAERMVTRLLQQKPEIAVPAEFAIRVRSRLPGRTLPARDRRTRSYGFATAIAALMLLALAWSVVAYVDPQGLPLSGRLSLILGYVVTFEIGAIALWLGLRRTVGS